MAQEVSVLATKPDGLNSTKPTRKLMMNREELTATGRRAKGLVHTDKHWRSQES